ncbi:hypothetical protein PENTCL1PPCAC_3154 [Pristionchus entomophagus]|uniref:G protein-coupled receptor n=1 Tax=Pristionchus entomophagus TaxID=358040 RepID=A0AAV5SLJ0_9BILA|nr:hypothetical protein PENTCL1PPCAC_3154 [Pristionchus entomophagus]
MVSLVNGAPIVLCKGSLFYHDSITNHASFVRPLLSSPHNRLLSILLSPAHRLSPTSSLYLSCHLSYLLVPICFPIRLPLCSTLCGSLLPSTIRSAWIRRWSSHWICGWPACRMIVSPSLNSYSQLLLSTQLSPNALFVRNQ